MVVTILASIAKNLLIALLTETVVKEVTVGLLRYGANLSHTEVDNQMVESVAKAWNVK